MVADLLLLSFFVFVTSSLLNWHSNSCRLLTSTRCTMFGVKFTFHSFCQYILDTQPLYGRILCPKPFPFHQLFVLCFYSFLYSASEILSSHGTVSSNKMTYFLSIRHTSRSGCCVVVNTGDTSLDSKSAENIHDLPHLLPSSSEVT